MAVMWEAQRGSVMENTRMLHGVISTITRLTECNNSRKESNKTNKKERMSLCLGTKD